MRSKALAQNAPIQWSTNRGRNGHDVPSDVAFDQSCESLNVDLVQHSLGRRRNGAVRQIFTGAAFTIAGVLARFSPGQDNTKSELHFTAQNGPEVPFIVRVAGGTVAQALTVADPILDALKATWTVLNGKLYWAFPSAANRLHVYDPALSTTTVRRVGLAAPTNPPVVIDAGTGTYPAVLRHYRVRRQVRLADGTLQRESEPSPATPFTPSGTGQGAAIGRPAGSGGGETHWQVEGSADGGKVFFILAVLVFATVDTYLDSAAPSTYASNPAAPLLGTRSPFPSVKYLTSDENRLLGFGVWPTAAFTDGGGAVPQVPGRVYFTPVLDSTDQDDDERIDWGADSPGYIDVGRNRGYEDRGICGPMDGQFLVGQSRGLHLLVPTGDNILPFQRVTLSAVLGFVSHHSTFIGEDESGRPCIYFLDDARGPYRYGRNGLEWVGHDVQDIWALIHLEAFVVAHGYFDVNMRACVWFISTRVGAPENMLPNRCLVFFVDGGRSDDSNGVRGGWTEYRSSRWVSAQQMSSSSVMFAETIGNPNSRRETGYVAGVQMFKLNIPGAQHDDGTAFAASVTSPMFEPPPKHVNKTAGVSYLQSSAHAGVSIRQTLTRNFGDKPGQVSDVSVAPQGPETRRLSAFKELAVPDASGLQVTLGDAAAVAVPAWTLDDWLLTFEQGDER